MSPIGVSLDLKALAKIQSKSELVQLKQQAKIDAVNKGKTRFSPGNSKDFIFVMWDLPPELEQSAIYVAFRAGRGTVRPWLHLVCREVMNFSSSRFWSFLFSEPRVYRRLVMHLDDQYVRLSARLRAKMKLKLEQRLTLAHSIQVTRISS